MSNCLRALTLANATSHAVTLGILSHIQLSCYCMDAMGLKMALLIMHRMRLYVMGAPQGVLRLMQPCLPLMLSKGEPTTWKMLHLHLMRPSCALVPLQAPTRSLAYVVGCEGCTRASVMQQPRDPCTPTALYGRAGSTLPFCEARFVTPRWRIGPALRDRHRGACGVY